MSHNGVATVRSWMHVRGLSAMKCVANPDNSMFATDEGRDTLRRNTVREIADNLSARALASVCVAATDWTMWS